jgi:hypothetical protein
LPDSDQVICVTSKQVLAISRPCERNHFRLLGLGTSQSEIGLKLVNKLSLFKVVDLNSRSSGSTEPVSVRRECKRVNLITRRKRVQVVIAVEIPQDDRTVFTTRGAQ